MRKRAVAVAKFQTGYVESPASRPKTKAWRLRARVRPRFAEFSRVKALKAIHEHDQVAPAGSIGTVVEVVRGGEGYIVEFTSPSHVVVAARPNELAAA
jgi:hypothetical protein